MNKQSSESSLQYLSLREVKNLIDSIENIRDKLSLRILYETGCTLRELVNIKVKDIQGNKIKVVDPETKEIRYPQISSKLSKDIKLYIKGNALTGYLIATRQSSKISEKRIRQIIQKHTKKVFSIKINPQSFRYYHIAHAYSNGVLLETIAKQLGITTFRIFSIIDELRLNPGHNYNNFLKRI